MANKVSNSNSSIERLRSLRVALVHDDLVQEARGGEEVFLAIAELFPEAPIYTSMVTPEWASKISNISNHSNVSNREIITSFMQKIPLKRRLQRALFFLYPLAFESFDFSDYDLVISSSSRFAHGIITKPETKHICYMNNPGRMFWEVHQYFGAEHAPRIGNTRIGKDPNNSNGSGLQKVLSPALSYLRLWSYAAAQRVDYFIANSQNIAGKIKRYFGREASVVYPFVDLRRFAPQVVNGELSMVNGIEKKKQLTINHLPAKPAARHWQAGKPLTGGYYLVVTRLNRWKRVEIAVQAVERLNTRMRESSDHSNRKGWKLVVVGEGPERKRLEALARVNGKWSMVNGQIEFLGGVSPERLRMLYQNCAALLMTQEEDFGITSLEAQACGRPVIAYGAGGALETVVPGKTGEFFKHQSAESLMETLKRFRPEHYDPKECRKNAERFGRARFQKNLLKEIERAVNSKQSLFSRGLENE